MSLKGLMNKVILATLAVLGSNLAIASVITGNSANVITSNALPADIQLNSFESNDSVFLFSEKKNTVLSSDLLVNFVGTGFYQPTTTNEAATSVISAGSVVDSYLFHLDSVGNASVRQTGFVTFDTEILGVIGSFDPLILTDALLGIAGTQYETTEPGFGGRGLEGADFTAPGKRDIVSISHDGKTMNFNLGAGNWFDNFRVITASEIHSVPEPSSLILLVLALPLLVFLKRSRIQ